MLRHQRVLWLIIMCSTIVSCSAKSESAPGSGNEPTAEVLELSTPQGNVVLEVTGSITRFNAVNRALFDLDMLRSLPSASVETHTSVTDGVKRFEGFLLRDFLSGLGARGDKVVASALNDYVIEIPMEDLRKFDVIVAHSMDGKPLSPSNKGPLWIVYPRDDHPELQDIRYDYRWVWQLNSLKVK